MKFPPPALSAPDPPTARLPVTSTSKGPMFISTAAAWIPLERERKENGFLPSPPYHPRQMSGSEPPEKRGAKVKVLREIMLSAG